MIKVHRVKNFNADNICVYILFELIKEKLDNRINIIIKVYKHTS